MFQPAEEVSPGGAIDDGAPAEPKVMPAWASYRVRYAGRSDIHPAQDQDLLPHRFRAINSVRAATLRGHNRRSTRCGRCLV